MGTQNSSKCICQRCGHTWNKRITGRPVQCPLCKSPKWDSKKDGVR